MAGVFCGGMAVGFLISMYIMLKISENYRDVSNKLRDSEAERYYKLWNHSFDQRAQLNQNNKGFRRLNRKLKSGREEKELDDIIMRSYPETEQSQ